MDDRDGRFPDVADLVRASEWVAGVPGLPVAAGKWLRTLPAERDRLTEQARRLSRPRLAAAARARSGGGGGAGARAGPRRTAARRGGVADRTAAAAEIRRAFERLGPTYVKLGQLVASAGGIVPVDVAEEFGKCRDAVPADDAATVRATIEAELGPVGDVFDAFDERPLASASIAQVHLATLPDGREVVVKVQHPGIRRRFRSDIAVMAWQAALLDRLRRLGIVNPPAFVELFATMALQELDFRIEALNMCEIGAALEHAGLDYVRCPRPLPPYVTRKVLVMERLSGIPYSEPAAVLDAGVDTGRLISLGIRAVLEGTLVYGVFHGDLHAGNLLVMPPDAFGLLDYGIVGRLSVPQRLALVRFITAAVAGDVDGQVGAMEDFGAFPPGTDTAALVRSLQRHAGRIESRLLEDAENIGLDDLAGAVGLVVTTLSEHGFRTPVELMLFMKNLLYLNASVVSLAPDLDLLAEITPIFFYFAAKHGDLLGGAGVTARPPETVAARRRDVAERLLSGRLGAELDRRLR